ncbi:hypothetical protein GE09DRAFT_186320 [Coniochaeta sp. 2T2.1]|nr:hypothetical protein GE09DRAFT_186320 [Coniochaeta sp. 2T2.1]
MSPQPPAGGFSLFPNTTNPVQRPPSRNHASRATTPQPGGADSGVDMTPPRHARKPSVRRQASVREGKQVATLNGRISAMDGRVSAQDRREDTVIERPAPVAFSKIPPRCDTAFSEAQTLVRSGSTRSRSSIAKPALLYEPPTIQDASSSQDTGLRSIFPTYNPTVPLDRQEYYPTQASPTHIPRSAISRPLYSPGYPDPRTPGPTLRSPMSAATPMSAGTVGRWPQRPTEPPVVPNPSSTDELKGLWKVNNGWKASASEGRTYCLKMTAEKDTPVYNLSSASQPFYNLRLDPTSASAYVTLTRHDPHKSYKGVPPPTSSNASTSSKSEAKNWQEALTTTLEEESRRLPPNDGLVALLYPTAATKMALERPDDPTTVARAEQECARLVWDADSSNYFLVHPALAMPFCVTVERNPAWSRTEYTLEHLESPQHVARLTRDGTGEGWLEIDTAIASKIDAVYLVDVAVAALMLVAHKDDQFAKVEVFEPPPVLRSSPDGSVRSSRHSISGRFSRQSKRDSKREQKREKKMAKKKGGGSRMEEFEVDVESQNSEGWKLDRKEKKGKQKKDKLPFVLRVAKALFKATFWCVTIGFRALAAVVAGLAKCLGAQKR